MNEDFDLTEGCYDESDLCRGYGELSNDLDKLYDIDGVGVGVDQYKQHNANDNDVAPDMPADFYQSVEVFLSKAPPKLIDSAPKVNKSTSKKHQDKGIDANTGQLMFPRLVPVKNEGVTIPPLPPTKASKVKSKIYSDAQRGNKAPVHIDHSLLQEAFAYTEMLLKTAMAEESMEENVVVTAHKGSSDPRDKQQLGQAKCDMESAYRNPGNQPPLNKKGVNAGNSLSKTSSGAAVGVVKKLRSRSQPSNSMAAAVAFDAINNQGNHSGGFHVAVEAEADSRKNAVDFDELIANFQDGITLNRLRRDLEESKRSMKKSEDFLRQLSKDFLHGLAH